MFSRIAILLLVCQVTLVAQNKTDHRKEALLLKKYLSEKHVSPPPIDDAFSERVYKGCLDLLDPDHLYFTDPDIQSLLPFKTKIDNELNGEGWNFLNHITLLYKKALERAEVYVTAETDKPFSNSSKEFFLYDSIQWARDENALNTKWSQWLRYETLERLIDQDTGTYAPDFFSRNEGDARKRIRARELRNIHRVLHHPTGYNNYMTSSFFQCVAAAFDPHTSYFPKTEMENFLSSLSTEGYYFGVTLDENERGDVMIAALAPGSPAWKCGELNTSDVLVNLKWEGQDPIDMTGISVEETNEILMDANHTSLEFTVRKASGLLKTVRLQKEKITMEGNFVRSYLLKGEHVLGYVSLPDFYTQWGDASEGSRCANDVAREIMKLKKENIEGLILDVRYNGGGSLQEALAMAGIFIDEGVLVTTKDRLGNEVSLKDMNRGTVYDGPLVLLMNGQSASASELLAGALQDYNRAVLVGSTTFGKATAQNFFPLGTGKGELSLESLKDGYGVASITTMKFYRVTGKSHQGRGVKPDILLPDVFDALNVHEISMPYALPLDTALKRTYYKKLKDLPRERLNQQSLARISQSPAFRKVEEAQRKLSEEIKKKDEPVSLAWDTFRKERKHEAAFYSELKTVYNDEVHTFRAVNNAEDQQRLGSEKYSMEFNQNWINNLQRDIYVEEAFNVLSDVISQKK